MTTCSNKTDTLSQFLAFVKENCSETEFNNWITPIQVKEETDRET